MRVLLVANINSSHTKKWALALRNKNVDVALFSLNTATNNDLWYKDFRNLYVPQKKVTFLFKKYIVLIKELRQMIAQFNPDIVHSHFLTNYSLLPNLLGFKQHVSTAWGSDVYIFPKKNKLNAAMLRYNLKNASAVISTSNAMAKEMQHYCSREINVIPFGIDLNSYTKKDYKPLNSDTTIEIYCFKKLEPIYNTDVLINAFALASKKLLNYNLRLNLVGDGSLTNEMAILTEKLDIKNKVVFHGWVHTEKIPQLLRQADLCVYLSANESFGVSLIEAMATGVPVIATKTPGFLEVANNDNNVLFVPFNDPEQAAEAIVRLINEPVLYSEITDNAYTHVKAHYDLENNIDQQLALYKEVLERNKK